MKASVISNIKTINQHCGLISVSIPIFIFLLGCFCTSIVSVNNVSALTYTDNVGLNFTFNPSITVSLSNASGSGSADLVINDLTPGTSSDSNIINVSVITNNANGYSLGANVGSSTLHNSNNAIYSTDRLIHSAYTSTDNINATPPTKPIFTNLTSTVSALTDFNDNTWGYTYSLDNGTTWINAHEETEGTKDTGYNGLPLYSTTPAELTTKSSPSISTGDTIQFKIGAKASTTQSSGEYNNVINFIAVGNTNPTSFYDAFKEAQTTDPTITQLNGYWKMQDMSPTICNAVEVYDDDSHIQLIDTRDNEIYWIGKLKDDRCWLLDNLRLGSNDYEIPLTPQDTNIETAWTLPRGVTSNFNSYPEPRIITAYKNDTNVTSYSATSGKVGVYYNFCAASGGTYCYDSSSGIGNAEHDVCPIHWRLSTGGHDDSSEILNVARKYGFTSQYHPGDILYKFGTVLAGYNELDTFYAKNVSSYIWSSTYLGTYTMYVTSISDFDFGVEGGRGRSRGYSIRCIANNE